MADFFQSVAPVKEVFMSVWGRSRCPSASSLSRFLAAVNPEAVGLVSDRASSNRGNSNPVD
ncbi:hypothetical protein [Leptolyngbya ohadii]|uniref:hypothetical protein n=1 Tax=Leptolyngbya ohadii TaxID=1962290 RepID=UPI00117B8BF4|nr:hypothetical protein [Leptolyngbya ohadii]